MTTNTNHSECTHEATKTARAACRRARVVETTDTIVNHTFVFTRRARAEGHSNTIAKITPFEVAEAHGYEAREWDYRLAYRMIRDRALLMGEMDLLADDIL